MSSSVIITQSLRTNITKHYKNQLGPAVERPQMVLARRTRCITQWWFFTAVVAHVCPLPPRYLPYIVFVLLTVRPSHLRPELNGIEILRPRLPCDYSLSSTAHHYDDYYST